MRTTLRNMMPVAAACALTACGGSGSHVSSTPPPIAAAPAPAPTPTPAPAASTQAVILSQPATQEFATFSAGSPLRVRYDASADVYEVNYSGDWQKLYPTPLGGPGSFFIGAATLQATSGTAYASTSQSPVAAWRYQYSSLAQWSTNTGQGGLAVFGTATRPEAVPVSGNATYSGQARGSTSAPADGGGWGLMENPGVDGMIAMNVDFGTGRLSGKVAVGVSCDCNSVPVIPATTFDAQLTSSTAAFSGQFAAQGTGPNSIGGTFTGPAAQEAIGQWAFPFILDGRSEVASGVWIAKRN